MKDVREYLRDSGGKWIGRKIPALDEESSRMRVCVPKGSKLGEGLTGMKYPARDDCEGKREIKNQRQGSTYMEA